MEMSQWNTLYNYLKQKYQVVFFFSQNVEQEGKSSPVWGLVPVGGGECKERV
jgi:hypothetical protein